MTAPAKEQVAQQTRPLGPHPGGEPRANPAARWITVAVGIAFIALSAVLARELWIMSGPEGSTSWLNPVFDFLGTYVVDAVAVTIGVVVAIIGLWLIIASFIPRARTHMRVNSPASIWVRPVDIARKATNTTRAETGGSTIRSKADRKLLTVQVEEDGTGTTQERVTHALNDEFRRLHNPPAVTVKVQQPVAAQTAQSTQPAQVAHPESTTQVTQVTETTEVQR